MTNSYKPIAIVTNTTTAISTGATFVHTINIPKANGGTITLEEAGGTDYVVIPASSGPICMVLDCVFPNGLQVITASADTVIITISQ